MQFFDSLIPLLEKKLDLLDKVITIKEEMDKIKDLLRFFFRKLSIIQNRMKVLIDGFYSLIISILNSNNQIKDWGEWSSSFNQIVDLP